MGSGGRSLRIKLAGRRRIHSSRGVLAIARPCLDRCLHRVAVLVRRGLSLMMSTQMSKMTVVPGSPVPCHRFDVELDRCHADPVQLPFGQLAVPDAISRIAARIRHDLANLGGPSPPGSDSYCVLTPATPSNSSTSASAHAVALVSSSSRPRVTESPPWFRTRPRTARVSTGTEPGALGAEPGGLRRLGRRRGSLDNRRAAHRRQGDPRAARLAGTPRDRDHSGHRERRLPPSTRPSPHCSSPPSFAGT